jgi:hypothetical protein
VVHAADLPTRAETRRRIRIAIVVYVVALTGLLLAAAYVAPATALDAPVGPNGTAEHGTTQQVR